MQLIRHVQVWLWHGSHIEHACTCVQVRNWMFTLFYVAAEMWGDVVLSLLFWGLANEMTSIRCVPLLCCRTSSHADTTTVRRP